MAENRSSIMSQQIAKMGIIGCGDFLRWQADSLKASKRLKVAAVFDPDAARSKKWADAFGATSAKTDDEIFADKSITVVALFVPPWIRKPLIQKAVQTGKTIITTKPLAASETDCQDLLKLLASTRCGVIYSRTNDSWVEGVKDVLRGGELGQLGLYRQDWLHHYPQWNTWALDPEKNGGPFMDAMVHNLNAARYLMGRPMTSATWFSDNHAHPDLKCADTESLKLDFENRGSAHLFITWAADLAVHSTEGNDREHHDWLFLVTDKGWRITKEWKDGKPWVKASRLGQDQWLPPHAFTETHYDRFVHAVATGAENPPDIATPQMAAEDILLIRKFKTSFARLENIKF